MSLARKRIFGPFRPAADVVFSAVGLAAAIEIWCRLKNEIFDPYRPELHYMRGPGPKWREHRAQADSDLIDAPLTIPHLGEEGPGASLKIV